MLENPNPTRVRGQKNEVWPWAAALGSLVPSKTTKRKFRPSSFFTASSRTVSPQTHYSDNAVRWMWWPSQNGRLRSRRSGFDLRY